MHLLSFTWLAVLYIPLLLYVSLESGLLVSVIPLSFVTSVVHPIFPYVTCMQLPGVPSWNDWWFLSCVDESGSCVFATSLSLCRLGSGVCLLCSLLLDVSNHAFPSPFLDIDSIAHYGTCVVHSPLWYIIGPDGWLDLFCPYGVVYDMFRYIVSSLIHFADIFFPVQNIVLSRVSALSILASVALLACTILCMRYLCPLGLQSVCRVFSNANVVGPPVDMLDMHKASHLGGGRGVHLHVLHADLTPYMSHLEHLDGLAPSVRYRYHGHVPSVTPLRNSDGIITVHVPLGAIAKGIPFHEL